MSKPIDGAMGKTGTWSTFKPVFDDKKCIKCGICEIFCAENCVVRDENGYPDFLLDYCKGCGVCEVECPTGAIEMVKK